MAAPESALDVVNLALLKLFAKPITSLTATGVVPMVANLSYDQTRRSLLRMYSWNFGKMRGVATLVNAPGSDTPLAPAFDYCFQYAMPNDLIRLLRVGRDERFHCSPRIRYDIQGRNILINPFCYWSELTSVCEPDPQTCPPTPPASIDVLYVMDAVDVTQFDPLFIEALATKVAAALCMPVTGSSSMAVLLEKQFDLLIKEVQGINFQEKPVEIIERDPIYESRMTASNAYYPESW